MQVEEIAGPNVVAEGADRAGRLQTQTGGVLEERANPIRLVEGLLYRTARAGEEAPQRNPAAVLLGLGGSIPGQSRWRRIVSIRQSTVVIQLPRRGPRRRRSALGKQRRGGDRQRQIRQQLEMQESLDHISSLVKRSAEYFGGFFEGDRLDDAWRCDEGSRSSGNS